MKWTILYFITTANNTKRENHLPNLSLLFLSVYDLEEGFDYTFQVIAMSYSDYQIGSDRISFKVPPYRRIRSVSIGLVTGIAFVAVIVLGVYFVRKKFCGSLDGDSGKRSK